VNNTTHVKRHTTALQLSPSPNYTHKSLVYSSKEHNIQCKSSINILQLGPSFLSKWPIISDQHL